MLQKEIKTDTDAITLPGQEVTPEQTVYTYDVNGSQLTKITSEKTETNTYNAVNQLVGFADGETTASYAYNSSGLRIEKIVDGQRINHVWDGSQQIVADIVDNQFYEAECYIRGTSLAATYNYRNGEKSGYTYYVQNAHGDVVNLTGANGVVIKSYTYDAFGVEKNIDDADTNAFRYCGEYYDTETGTVYLKARYYDPAIGRFISRDSFAGNNGDPLSLNLYTYCHNNPVIYIDPDGHFVISTLLVGAVVGAAISFGTKVVCNAIDGKKGKDLLDGTLKSVAIGAAGGMLAASGIGIAGQVVGNIALGAGDNIATQLDDMSVGKQEEFNGWSLATDVALSGLSAGLCGPGAKAKVNSVLSESKRAIRRVTKGFRGGKSLSCTSRIAKGISRFASEFGGAKRQWVKQVKTNLWKSAKKGIPKADYCLARTGFYMLSTNFACNTTKTIRDVLDRKTNE